MGRAEHEHETRSSGRPNSIGAVERAQFALGLLNGKWVVPLLDALAGRPRRHGELYRALEPGLSEKVLTETLRRMEAAKLVQRTATRDIPPSVLYALTDTGRSLLDLINSMSDWTASHWTELVNVAELAEG